LRGEIGVDEKISAPGRRTLPFRGRVQDRRNRDSRFGLFVGMGDAVQMIAHGPLLALSVAGHGASHQTDRQNHS